MSILKLKPACKDSGSNDDPESFYLHYKCELQQAFRSRGKTLLQLTSQPYPGVAAGIRVIADRALL